MKLFSQIKNGQSTIEAAFLIPIIFLCLLILIQPIVLLVNHFAMEAAAYEGCRYAATCNDLEADAAIKNFVEKRLRIFPRVEVVHVPPWNIKVEQDIENHEVSIGISHEVKPLPLVGSSILVLNSGFGTDFYHQEVKVRRTLHASWMDEKPYEPKTWIERWEKAV